MNCPEKLTQNKKPLESHVTFECNVQVVFNKIRTRNISKKEIEDGQLLVERSNLSLRLSLYNNCSKSMNRQKREKNRLIVRKWFYFGREYIE